MNHFTTLGKALLVATASIAFTGMVIAQQNAALVIGTSSLSSGRDDARTSQEIQMVANALEAAGYRVTQVANAMQAPDSLNGVAAAFLAASDASDSRIVYVSGRTVTADGTPYLLPSDFRAASAMSLALQGLNLDALAGELASGTAASLLMVNGAFSHQLDDELARVGAFDRVTDTLSMRDFGAQTSIVLSTAEETANQIRSRRNHAFDDAIVRTMSASGDPLSVVIADLVSDTQSSSSRRQRPQVRDLLSPDVLFGAQPIDPSEQRLWDFAHSTDTIEAYQTFLDVFPDGFYADQATAAIFALSPREVILPIEETYVIARNANVRSGPSTQDARIDTLTEGTLVYNVGKVDGERWYKLALEDGRTAYVFDSLVYPYNGSERQAWDQARAVDSIAGYNQYLSSFPNGANADSALVRRDDLLEAERLARLAPYAIVPASGEVEIVRRANVRDLPDGSGTRLTTLEEGTVLPLTGRSSVVDWVEVRLADGRIGYIWERLVQNYVAPPPQPTYRELLEDSGDVTLEILGEHYSLMDNGRRFTVSLRGNSYGPESDDRTDIIAAERRSDGRSGYELLVESELTGRYVAWLTDGNANFIGLESVDEGPGLEVRFGLDLNRDGSIGRPTTQPTPQPQPQPAPVIGRLQLTSTVPLMDRLSRRSQAIATLTEGLHVDVLGTGRNGQWTNVRLDDGVEGWVESQFLTEIITPDEVAYVELQDAPDIDGALAFLANFPDSPRVEQVRAMLQQLAQPRRINTSIVTTRNASLYNSDQSNARRIGSLQANTVLRANQISGAPQSYRVRLNNGRLAFVRANEVIPYEGSEKQAWDQAVASRTVAGFQAYLDAYPNGIYADEARQVLQQAQQGSSDNVLRFNLGGIDFNVQLN